MKKFLMVAALMTGLIFLNSTLATAGGHKKSGCAKCEAKAEQCKVSKLKKKVTPLWKNQAMLGISDEQMDKIGDIKHKAMKELIQLKADKDVIMVDVKTEMWAESIDVGAVNNLIDSKYASKKKAAKVFVKAIADIQQVLTEEQRAKWRNMSKCSKCAQGSSCAKCAASGGKVCPLTGKVLDEKGSPKGSMK